jgi:hypothetical protein
MPLLKPTRGIQINRSHPLAQGLVGCWLFNEGTGSFFQDTGGRKHHFNIGNGSPVFSTSRYGGGVLFNGGNNEYLQCNKPIVTQLPLTIVAWAKSDNINADSIILDIGNSSSGAGNIFLGLMGSWTGDPIAAYMRYTDWSTGTAITTKSFAANVWHQCAAVFISNNERRAYIDGGNEGIGTVSCNVPPVDKTHIGATADSSPAGYMSGMIDHVLIWNRALSAKEIAWLYREPFVMFEQGNKPASLFVPGIVELIGSAFAKSQLYGKLSTICRIPELECFWLRDVLFGGMTANAFKLGTVLTGSWFWMRINGCTALYRGGSLEQIDFKNILSVSEPDATEINSPAYVPHDNNSDYFYLVRRFNKCGLQEGTLSAAAKVSIQSDGSLKELRPNKIYTVMARQADNNKVQFTWFYNPLEQMSPPACFRIYSDNGTGEIDFENPLATIEYEGRKYYSYQSAELTAGQYLFAIRAENADGFDDRSLARIKIQLDIKNPNPIEILETQIV